jgi:hypothetical protein
MAMEQYAGPDGELRKFPDKVIATHRGSKYGKILRPAFLCCTVLVEPGLPGFYLPEPD